MLIVLEGMEGSGKSTATKTLGNALHMITTFEPCDPLIRGVIMDKKWDSLTETFLFASDRANHQALLKDNDVICDRYIDSNVVYQSILGSVDKEYIYDLNKNFVQPDIVFILDVSEDVARERINGRKNNNRFDEIDKLSTMRKAYLSLEDENHVVIDASQSVEYTIEQILNVLKERGLLKESLYRE